MSLNKTIRLSLKRRLQMESKSEFKQRMHNRHTREQQKMSSYLKDKFGDDYTHPMKKARIAKEMESCSTY